MSKVLRSSEFHKEVINKEGVVLVDFYADWCGPCKILAPAIEAIGKEMEGKARVYKVDIDESGDIAMRYGIMSIPTVMIFKDGKAVDRMVGFQPKDKLKNRLKNYI